MDRIVVALVLAAVSGSARAPAARFDLVCSGQIVDATGVAHAWTDRLSLDLESNRWCDQTAGCPYRIPVAARGGDHLQLLKVKTPYNEVTMSVDLTTGAISRITRIPDRPDSLMSSKGICEKANFTPPG